MISFSHSKRSGAHRLTTAINFLEHAACLCTSEVKVFMSTNQPCPGARFYRIEPGDTFFLIARRLGVSVDDLIALNPNANPYDLEVGSVICIPLERGIPVGRIPPCDSGLYWVIAPGDTLYNIAGTLGISVDVLYELNPGIDPLNLKLGDSLCLPRK